MGPRALGGAARLMLVLASSVGCEAAGDPSEEPSRVASRPAGPHGRALAPPDGFRATFDHTARPSGGLVRWRTRWVLRWEPVAGATSYVVRTATSEGAGGRSHEVETPRYSLEVAAGTSRPDQVERDRASQLAFTAATLRVRVAARGGTGRVSPPGPWLPVGEAPANRTGRKRAVTPASAREGVHKHRR
jgi:hypothetical protein